MFRRSAVIVLVLLWAGMITAVPSDVRAQTGEPEMVLDMMLAQNDAQQTELEEIRRVLESDPDLPPEIRDALQSGEFIPPPPEKGEGERVPPPPTAKQQPPAGQDDVLAEMNALLNRTENALTDNGEEQRNTVSTVSGSRIDHLQLKDMDIHEVLKLLSQKSGLNIIAGKNVTGKVSVYLKNVRLEDALRIILDANDLAYKEEDGIIRVMAADEFERRYGYVFGGKIFTRIYQLDYAQVTDVAGVLNQIISPNGKVVFHEQTNVLVVVDNAEKILVAEEVIAELDMPVGTRVYELGYAEAEGLLKKLENLITEGIGRIKYDERSNKLVVTDTPEVLQSVDDIVSAFDVQQQQVAIEAKIIQIALTEEHELGVNWQAVFTGLDDLTVTSDFDVIDASSANQGQLQVGTIAVNNYTALVEALDSVGETNILSSPSITAVSNEEAKIMVGSTRPYVTTTTTTPASGPTTVSENVSFIDVGVKLMVTPQIHKDGFITMKIRPEVSSVIDTLTTSENNTIPIVETSEAETTVRIKDGVTIVIGGLIKDDNRSTFNKVPLLGDIPFFGAAFRNEDESTIKTEIAIFLTPRIVDGDVTQEVRSLLTGDVK